MSSLIPVPSALTPGAFSRATRAALVLLLAGLLAAGDASVDLAAPRQPATWRASGFLHSITPVLPIDEQIEPLRPRLLRLRPAAARDLAKRAARLGATVHVVVSDAYGYERGAAWPGDDDDWSRWSVVAARVAGRMREAKLDGWFDVWNEPDGAAFWARSRGRFRACWARGVRTIRGVLPQARIVGPSLSRWDPDRLRAFLVDAVADGVAPDGISWHELGEAETIDHIPEHAAAVRAMLVELGLGERPLWVNEYMPERGCLSPGRTVRAISGLEAAGVAGAARACWSDPADDSDTGAAPVLDGLLDPDGKPRPVWWVHRQYGAMAGGLTALSGAAGLAAVDEAGTLRVLLARPPEGEGPPRLVVAAWPAGIAADIEVTVLPDLRARPLPRPAPLRQELTASDGRLVVPLPPLDPDDALTLTIRRRMDSPPR